MKFHSIETADLKWKVEDIYRERGRGGGGGGGVQEDRSTIDFTSWHDLCCQKDYVLI